MKLSSNDIVLFSGDSITDGNRGHKMDCNHIFGHGYQYIAAGELALKYASASPKFINKGYSGYSMPQLLESWDRDVLENKPTVVSILAGVNDAHQGYNEGRTVEETVKRFSDSLKGAIEKTKTALPNTKIIVCEPFYFPLDRSDLTYRNTPHTECEDEFLRPDRFDTDEMCSYRVEAIRQIRKTSKEIAGKQADAFVPLYEKIKDAISNSKPEYFIWDGTHPTIACHTLMAKEWLKAFEKM